MKKGAILLVTLLSLLLVVGCGSSTDQTSIIPSVATVSNSMVVPAGMTLTSDKTLFSGTNPLVGPKTETWVLTQGTLYTFTMTNTATKAVISTKAFTAASNTVIGISAAGMISENKSSNASTSALPTAVSAAAVTVPTGGSVTFVSTTANATVPTGALTADAKVELTPGAVYTVTVTEGGQTYSYTFTQPATAGGQSAISPAAAGFVFFDIASNGTATKTTFAPLAGGTVDTGTVTPTATETKTKIEVETEVGDVTVPSFSAVLSHDSDVDGDGKYSKGDKFKVTVSLNPGEANCKIYVKIQADGGYYVEGTRSYSSSTAITSAVVTTTDIASPAPHDAAGTYMQTFTQYTAPNTPGSFVMVNEDGTFPYSGTYAYEVMVTDAAGNMAKATGSVVVLP